MAASRRAIASAGSQFVRRGYHEVCQIIEGWLGTHMINLFRGCRHDRAARIAGPKLLGDMRPLEAGSAIVAATASSRTRAVHSIHLKIVGELTAISSNPEPIEGLRQRAFASVCESRTRA
jgi:hypothetical protein